MSVHEDLRHLLNSKLARISQSLGMNLHDLISSILLRILPHIPESGEEFLNALDSIVSFGYSVKNSVNKFTRTVNADGYEVVEFEVDILKPEIRILLIPKDNIPIDFLEIARSCDGWSINAKYYLEWLENIALTDEKLEYVNRVLEKMFRDKSMYVRLDQILGGYRIILDHYSHQIPSLDIIARVMEDTEELIKKILKEELRPQAD